MNQLIDQTREHIKKLFPRSRKILIKVDRDREKNFVTQILVRVPHRELHACKRDPDLHHSVGRAYQALTRQLEKIKPQRRKKMIENLEMF